MTENQRVAEETMSKTDNKAAADMTEAVSFYTLARFTVKKKKTNPTFPHGFIVL